MFAKATITAVFVTTAVAALAPSASAQSASVDVKSVSVSFPGSRPNNTMVATARSTSGVATTSGVRVTQRSATLAWPHVSAAQRTGYVNVTRDSFPSASYSDTQLVVMGNSACAGLKLTGRIWRADALRHVSTSLIRVYGITETQAYVVGVSAANQLCYDLAGPLGFV